MDFDPDEFLEATGIETRLGGARASEPPLSSAGAQAQAEMLQQLDGVRATLEILASLIRDHPNADAAFEAVNANFGRSLELARDAFQRFRDRRECKGES